MEQETNPRFTRPGQLRVNTRTLRDLMLEVGYGVRDLARAVDVNPSTVSRLLSGERNPSPALAVKIAAELRTPWREIFRVVPGAER